MSSAHNIFSKFESELSKLEKHMKNFRQYKSTMNNFFANIHHFTVPL